MTNEGVLETVRPKVLNMIIDGKRDSEIALVMGCSRQAVGQFRRKYASELQIRADHIVDVALKAREERIRELARLYGVASQEMEEYGITIVEERHEYSRGEETALIVTRDFRSAMVREMRGLIADIAAEMGERNLGKGDLNLLNHGTVIIVRNTPELGI